MAVLTGFTPSGLGWLPDLPDPRDYTVHHPEVVDRLGDFLGQSTPLPSRVDLRSDEDGCYFTPPRNQGRLHASPVFAVLAMVEYFQRKTQGKTYEGSPLFLYEMAQRWRGTANDSGISIRVTLKVLKRYGTPPEEMRPYTDQPVDSSLNDISLLGFAKDLSDIVYFRLDRPWSSATKTLCILKTCLAAGIPFVFGFSVSRSLTTDPEVPFRPRLDSYRGGQSVVAVGYNDHERIVNKGALLIRSSWGTDWGEKGYGWLPYAYVLQHQISDIWTMTSARWSGERPRS